MEIGDDPKIAGLRSKIHCDLLQVMSCVFFRCAMCLQEFMLMDSPNLEVNGLWDLASGQALQAFLKSQAGDSAQVFR